MNWSRCADLVDARLHDLAAQPNLEPDQRLRISLALLSVDPQQAQNVLDAMLDAEPEEALILRDTLHEHRDMVVGHCWDLLTRNTDRSPKTLRAAVALARFDDSNPQWQKMAGMIAEEMTTDNPIYLKAWVDGLRPVKEVLIAPLADVCRDADPQRSATRLLAANVLADYAADAGHVPVLADLVMDGDKAMKVSHEVESVPVRCTAISRMKTTIES